MSADIVAAPWQLTGHGYVIPLRCTAAFGHHCVSRAPDFAGEGLGGLGALMIIDYADSNVGPYRELLLSPGLIRLGTERARAITHIWVSSRASAMNGRHNWGLPKQQAAFTVEENDDGSETFAINQGDNPPLRLTLAPRGPVLPVTTNVLPRSWRTLVQPWRGQCYQTVIRARGRARYCSLSSYENPAASGFPDFADQKRLAGVAASEFVLTFPEPIITPLETQ